MTLDAETTGRLEATLDPSKVATLSFGGRRLSYLEGWYVISAANGIFGFDGWSHEIVSIEHMGNGLYMARVRVDALGVTRLDVGTANAAADTAEAHETAIKGAATDGLKRALRTFGAQFGNELYDKGAGQAPPPQAQQRPQERASATEQPRGAGFAHAGQLFTWAKKEHGMAPADVLMVLDVAGPEAIDLDTAQQRIEAALAPSGAR